MYCGGLLNYVGDYAQRAFWRRLVGEIKIENKIDRNCDICVKASPFLLGEKVHVDYNREHCIKGE